MLATVLAPKQAFAEYQCPVPTFVYEPGSAVLSDPNEDVMAEADRVVSTDGVVTLNGNTSITYQNTVLTAKDAQYSPESGEVKVEGELKLSGDGFSMQSENAIIDMDDKLFSTADTEYELGINNRYATGTAKHMERNEKGEFTLEGATYTSCPLGDKSWYLRAKQLRLYPDDGIGTARNLALIFKGVPILAVPAFSFPISSKRKTGFLSPVIAHSDHTGFELQLPWYWNIRPNMDATFIPRFTSKRGTQLKAELRYKNTLGEWVFDTEYLNDNALNNQKRTFSQIRHNGHFGSYWSSEIQASTVSDKDYFEDLGNSLQLASITHLDRRTDLRFNNGPLSALVRLQSYQTIDESTPHSQRPYLRLPQLSARWEAPKDEFGVRASLQSELVYFDRMNSITGSRFDIQPRIWLPLSRNAWFLTPALGYRFSFYSLTTGDEQDQETSISRNLTSFSVDSGLFFDRKIDDRGSVQTLEPRLFYLRVPYQNQSSIPLFDTSELDFNISQLFRENRFSGADRIADANQVSLALTSRFINGDDGREMFKASIGQIFYFRDRLVSLDNDIAQTHSSSDIVGEFSSELHDNWVASGSLQWNKDNQNTVRGALLLSYRPDSDHIVNVAHRTVNTGSSAETEQLDFSALWPIRDNWRIATRWNYSLDDNVSLESLLGVQYDSCCWALRFAARRFIADDGEDHETSLYLQLVLKGLAPVGQNYGALLQNAILGYQDEY